MNATPARKAHRLYRGEVQKFLMLAVLCAVVFARMQPLDAAGFFTAFLVMMLLGRAVPAWRMFQVNRG
jgi:F0F1-type ATP synthase assembly protein I